MHGAPVEYPVYNGNDVSRAEDAGSESVPVGTAGKSCYTVVCEVFDWHRPRFLPLRT